MDCCGVNRDGLFGADVRAILEVAVLAFLLSLQVETGKTTKVLLDDRLVDSSATANTLSVVVSNSVRL